MSALALAFFDSARDLYGTARSGTTILFEGRSPVPHPEGPALERSGAGWHAELGDVLALDLEPVCETIDLDGLDVHLCRVKGTAAGGRVDCLGTLAETRSAPEWEQLDALRTLSALVDERHAFLALARRPRGARGHGEESVSAVLIDDGTPTGVDDARLSTVYDGQGRQRSAGLELWLPGEELPRRGSGSVIAGSSLALAGLEVHTAVFQWRLEGRDAIGAYELTVRSEPPAAA